MSDSQRGLMPLYISFKQKYSMSFGILLLMFMSTSSAESQLTLEVGLQQSYQSLYPIGRIAVGEPGIADVSVITETEILITPLQPGVTSLTIWSKNNSEKQIVQLTVTASKKLKQRSSTSWTTPACSWMR